MHGVIVAAVVAVIRNAIRTSTCELLVRFRVIYALTKGAGSHNLKPATSECLPPPPALPFTPTSLSRRPPSHVFLHRDPLSQQRLLVVSFVILHAAQQLTGINAIFYYSNSFFVGIIDDPLVGTTLVGVVNVVATYVALQLMDKTGRVCWTPSRCWDLAVLSCLQLMLPHRLHFLSAFSHLVLPCAQLHYVLSPSASFPPGKKDGWMLCVLCVADPRVYGGLSVATRLRKAPPLTEDMIWPFSDFFLSQRPHNNTNNGGSTVPACRLCERPGGSQWRKPPSTTAIVAKRSLFTTLICVL